MHAHMYDTTSTHYARSIEWSESNLVTNNLWCLYHAALKEQGRNQRGQETGDEKASSHGRVELAARAVVT